MIAFLLGSLYIQIGESKKNPFESSENKLCTIYGRVLSVQQKDKKYFKLLMKTVEGEKILISVNGELDRDGLKDSFDYIGRNVQARGMIQMPVSSRNPGGFDYKLYLKTRGIKTLMKVQATNLKLIEGMVGNLSQINIFSNRLAQIKYGYMSKLESVMSPNSYGMLVGILFGDKVLLDEDTYEAFQRNGVAHILSVSGIHVGIVYLYINKLLGNRRTVFSGVVAFLMLITYGALSEFAPSVIRSIVMIAIHILSKYIHRRYDLLTCTASSALGMLLFNPYYIFSVGFQLSYLAVFCLAVLLPWMNRRIDFLSEGPCPERIIKLLYFLSPLLAIQIGMTPFSVYCFNYFSVTSLFLNIPIIFISGIILPLGMCLIPLSWLTSISLIHLPIGEVIFGIGATLSELFIDAMVLLNNTFYCPGISYINLVSPSIWLLLLYYTIFFFCFSEWFRVLYQRKRYKRIGTISIIFLILSLALPNLLFEDYSKAKIIFLDVGQGDCLVLKTPKGKNIIIDGGGSQNYDVGKKTLLPYLLKNKISHIDLALVTHLHDDHFLGISSLSKEMKIKQLGMYEVNKYREKSILKKTGVKKEAMLYLVKGQKLIIEDGIWIDILYPKEKTEKEYKEILKEDGDENESSLLMKVHYLGIEILMTGDMGFKGEDAVMKLYSESDKIKADILKVGHHGSKYSTSDAFLQAVSPKIAVFQVGKNNFGHPSQAVIEKCQKNGIMIYRNDLNGAIMLQKGNQWLIKTMLIQSTRTRE